MRRALLGPSLLLPISVAAGKPVRHAVAAAHTSPVHLDSAVVPVLEHAALQAGLGLPVLNAALRAYSQAEAAGAVRRAVLTVIDYSLPSHMRRLWVLDLRRGLVLAHELVAHGRGSGDDVASRFSNAAGSVRTSLGTFVTAGTYLGAHGRSLRLEGLNAGLNDHAMARGIVVHAAPYVSEDAIRQLGRLGRSEGCPALNPAVAPHIIDMIEGGSVLFSYYPAPELQRVLGKE